MDILILMGFLVTSILFGMVGSQTVIKVKDPIARMRILGVLVAVYVGLMYVVQIT